MSFTPAVWTAPGAQGDSVKKPRNFKGFSGKVSRFGVRDLSLFLSGFGVGYGLGFTRSGLFW